MSTCTLKQLTSLPQWVTWRYENGTKVPYNPKTGHKADSTDTSTWATHQEAIRAANQRKHDGIGFVFTSNDPYVGIDLDDCIDDAGAIATWALEIINELNSYTEVSPSKHGVKIWVAGDIPSNLKTPHVEIYRDKRYFTFTGEHLAGTPQEIRNVNGTLTALYERTKPRPPAVALPQPTTDANVSDAFLQAWARRVADSAIRIVAHAPEGNKHNARCKAGYFWAGLIAHRLATAGEIEAALFHANKPKTNERKELKTLRDAIAAGSQHPLEIPSPTTVLEDVAYRLNPTTGEVEEAPLVDGEKPTPEHAARLWGKQYRDAWAYDDSIEGWRHWTGTYWQEEPDNSRILRDQAVHVMQVLNMPITSKGKIDLTVERARSYCQRKFHDFPNLVNFQNGMLDVTTRKLWPHKHDDNLRYCLPYDYVQTSYPAISAFLEQTMPDEAGRRAYMAHIGLALLGDSRLHKAVLLLGPRRSGKSTALKLANAAAGNQPDANAGTELFSSELEGMRSRVRWNSRRLVTLEELPAEALRNEEIFKAMTAHGGVSMRGMNVLEKTDNRWLPKLLMATNEAPRYSDRSGALTERLVIVRCPNTRAEQDRDIYLFDSFQVELGAFAAACLTEAEALLKTGRYDQSDAMRKELETIETHGDNVKLFVGDMCILGADDLWEPTAKLYGKYLDYCEENGIQDKYRMQKARFTEALGQRFSSVFPRLKQQDGKKVRAVVGLRLRLETDPDPSEGDTPDTPEIHLTEPGCIASEPHQERLEAVGDTPDTPHSLSTHETERNGEGEIKEEEIKDSGVSPVSPVSPVLDWPQLHRWWEDENLKAIRLHCTIRQVSYSDVINALQQEKETPHG